MLHASLEYPRDQSLESNLSKQSQIAFGAIRTISPELHDTLLNLYWTHHGTVIHLVDRELFQECRIRGGGPYHSHLLHLAMLAMGSEFVELALGTNIAGGRENTFHQTAKLVLWDELENPKLATTAALLILSDLECGIGNRNLGRRYAGLLFPHPSLASIVRPFRFDSKHKLQETII